MVIIFPYREDLHFISSRNKVFYSQIINNVSKYVSILDLSESFLKKKNINKYFVNSFYGAHLSKMGNKHYADEIYNYLLKNKFIIN